MKSSKVRYKVALGLKKGLNESVVEETEYYKKKITMTKARD